MILLIDTSNKESLLVLAEKDRIVKKVAFSSDLEQSEKLLPSIKKLFIDCKISEKDLEAIAVIIGPGSYTGLRVGVATANSLAWSYGIPVIGIDKLKLYSKASNNKRDDVCSIVANIRDLVYAGLFNNESEKGSKSYSAESLNNLLSRIHRPTFFIGEISDKEMMKIKKKIGDKFAGGEVLALEDKKVLKVFLKKQGSFLKKNLVVPFYINPPHITQLKQ